MQTKLKDTITFVEVESSKNIMVMNISYHKR